MRFFWGIMAAGAFLTGCPGNNGADVHPIADASVSTSLQTCPSGAPVDIYVADKGSCTTTSTIVGRGGSWRVSRERDQVCTFRWDSTTAEPDRSALEHALSRAEWVEPDCSVMVSASSSLGANMTPNVTDDLAQRIRSKMLRELHCPLPLKEKVPPTPASILNPGWQKCFELPPKTRLPSRTVKVAVIDSARFEGIGESRSGHATMVARLIGQIAGTHANVQVSAELALKRSVTDQGAIVEFDDDFGGHFGTRNDLAVALERTRASWDPQTERLIVNLSLGWSAQYLPSGATHLSDEVRDELARLRGAGALIIAAAGNRSVDASTGPLYPASYESSLSGPPLVYAVGGTKRYPTGTKGAYAWNDIPLGISRPGGMPRLAAVGSYAADYRDAGAEALIEVATYSGPDVRGRLAKLPSTPSVPQNLDLGIGGALFSGTSVAAANASGAAALVWSLRPDLDADQVIELLYTSGSTVAAQAGSNTPATADFGVQQGADVRTIHICRALRLACGEETAPCGFKFGEIVLRCEETKLPWRALLADLWPNRLTFAAVNTATAAPAVPSDSSYDQPWIGPQPGSSRCGGGCFESIWPVPSSFSAQIVPAVGEKLKKMVVSLTQPGTPPTYYTTIFSPLLAGPTVVSYSHTQRNANGSYVQFTNASDVVVSTEELIFVLPDE